MKTIIPTKKLRKAQRYQIAPDLFVFEFHNKKLIPVSEADKYVPVSIHTIRDWIKSGKLKRYQANGLPKKGSGGGKVFFNYDEFLRLTNI